MVKKTRIKKNIIIIIFLFFFLSPIFGHAANLNNAFTDIGPLEKVAGNDGAGYETSAENTVERMISKVITTALTFVGVVFLILAIYAGYNWMTAQGDEEKVTKAKDTLTAAIIGLVIVIAAYAISWYIINAIGGAALKSK